MSEKLLPCPFCGGEARTFEYDGANQATCGGKHIDCAGTDVVAPVAMWNRRTPAPEGEACPTCNGVRPEFCSNAFHLASPVVPAPEGEAWRTVPVEPTEAMLDAACESGPDTSAGRFDYSDGRNVWQTMLAASPVVPVGVSEEQRQRVAEIVEAAIERHAPANSIRHTLDDVDAIIAALRPTDTGWRDIATAPKDNNEFLIGWSGGGVDIGWWNSMRDYVDWKDSLKPSEDPPTHWMPLPPAPTDTGANHD